jgi:hypothetical protein
VIVATRSTTLRIILIRGNRNPTPGPRAPVMDTMATDTRSLTVWAGSHQFLGREGLLEARLRPLQTQGMVHTLSHPMVVIPPPYLHSMHSKPPGMHQGRTTPSISRAKRLTTTTRARIGLGTMIIVVIIPVLEGTRDGVCSPVGEGYLFSYSIKGCPICTCMYYRNDKNEARLCV